MKLITFKVENERIPRYKLVKQPVFDSFGIITNYKYLQSNEIESEDILWTTYTIPADKIEKMVAKEDTVSVKYSINGINDISKEEFEKVLDQLSK